MTFRRLVRALWLAYLAFFQPQVLYNLMGLIRGPDLSAAKLKWVFTGWARSLLFPSLNASGRGLFVRRFEFLTWKDVDKLCQELKRLAEDEGNPKVHHFLVHMEDGMQRLESLPLLTKEERNEVKALGELASRLAACFSSMPPLQTPPSEAQLREWYEEWFEKS